MKSDHPINFTLRKIVGNQFREPSKHKAAEGRCLLLTATIAPPQSAVPRSNPRVRLNDYIESLNFYLSLPANYIDRVLFIDNSGSNTGVIEKFVSELHHDKLVEILSFTGNDHPVSYGKAYGEFKLIDIGLKYTSLLAMDDIFWKITGRLQVFNLTEIMKAVRNQYDIVCDLHSVPWIGTGKLFGNKWMDLRLFSCSVRAYNLCLRDKYAEFGPGTDQHSLYRAALQARAQFKVLPRFPIQPIIHGISGRHGRNYNAGLERVKTGVRTYVRRWAPVFWL